MFTRFSYRAARNSVWKAMALALLATLQIGCGSEEAQVAGPRPVKAVQVGEPRQSLVRSFPGRAKSDSSVDLAFRVSGPMIERPVNRGDIVRRGQVLARIDPRDFERNVAAATAQLANARAQLESMKIARPEDIKKLAAALSAARAQLIKNGADYERIELLYINDNAPKTDLDAARAASDVAQANLDGAEESLSIGKSGARSEDIDAMEASIRALEAQLEIAKDALDDTYLRAPYDGMITDKYGDVFDTVSAYAPIIRVVDNRRIKMVVFVPENMISYVPDIESVICRFDVFPGVDISARIHEVGRETSLTTRTYPVTVIMDPVEGTPILPGMAGEAEFVVPLGADAAGGMEVPAAAVFVDSPSGPSSVWVIDRGANTVVRREVSTRESTASGVLVTSGVSPGEWVVAAGVQSLSEGAAVTILDQGAAE